MNVKVKPAPGRKVLDPLTKKFIPDDGAEVPESTYWHRRIRCGDVVLVTEPVVLQDQISDSTHPDGQKGEE